MKKFQAIMLALCVVFAFSAVLVGSASAETTLLAEWLANSLPITTNLGVETSGSLLLEDTETLVSKAAVVCSAILRGTVGPNGEDEITEVLTLLKGLPPLKGTGSKLPDCEATTPVTGCAEGTAASPIEVNPVGLPWKTLLFLMENGEFLILIYGHGTPPVPFGYKLLCLALGLNAEDTCTELDAEALVLNSTTTGDAFTPAGQKITPNANCTQSGGKATGVNETFTASTMTLENGELLTVSSE